VARSASRTRTVRRRPRKGRRGVGAAARASSTRHCQRRLAPRRSACRNEPRRRQRDACADDPTATVGLCALHDEFAWRVEAQRVGAAARRRARAAAAMATRSGGPEARTSTSRPVVARRHP